MQDADCYSDTLSAVNEFVSFSNNSVGPVTLRNSVF